MHVKIDIHIIRSWKNHCSLNDASGATKLRTWDISTEASFLISPISTLLKEWSILEYDSASSATMSPWLEWWVLPTVLPVWKKMRVVRIRGFSGMFRICRMKQPTANLKQIIGWVHGDPHGGHELWELQRLLCKNPIMIYHPTILPSPKWLDLHRFEVQRGDTSQARTKKGAGLEIADGKPTDFQDRYLRWIKKKILGFHQIPVFFFWKIGFQFPDCFFQMCQIVTRLPFKNPRYSDDLSSSMKLPDLRDRSIDAEWLFNVPAFLIVDPVACEWTLQADNTTLGIQ